MKHFDLSTVATLSFVLFIYIILTYVITGATTVPTEGDSLAYHIPIAQTIWNGQFFHPKDVLGFYPSNVEVLLSLFLLLHIPLNLFNVLAVVLLFFVAKELGEEARLDDSLATLFAVSLCLMPLTLRWILTQVVDIWIGLFYAVSLLLLLNPQRTWRYFLALGIIAGLLFGAKTSGPLFVLLGLAVFFKGLIRSVSISRFVIFLLPLSVLGFFWYIRNFLLTGNPLYPQGFWIFHGAPHWDLMNVNIAMTTFSHPFGMFNAVFSEYTVWTVALLIPAFVILFWLKKGKKIQYDSFILLTLLGYLNLVFFFFLPTLPHYNNMVSSFRYSFPVFIPLILSTFLAAKAFNREDILILVAFASFIVFPSFPYHPKILFLLIPVLFLVFSANRLKVYAGKLLHSIKK